MEEGEGEERGEGEESEGEKKLKGFKKKDFRKSIERDRAMHLRVVGGMVFGKLIGPILSCPSIVDPGIVLSKQMQKGFVLFALFVVFFYQYYWDLVYSFVIILVIHFFFLNRLCESLKTFM